MAVEILTTNNLNREQMPYTAFMVMVAAQPGNAGHSPITLLAASPTLAPASFLNLSLPSPT